MPILDLSHDSGNDLVGKRLIVIPTDGEGEHGRLSQLAKLAWRTDQYSHAD
jgi:hypothetical protein